MKLTVERIKKSFIRRVSLPVAKQLSMVLHEWGFRLEPQMDIHHASPWHQPEFTQKYGGYLPSNNNIKRSLKKGRSWDRVRQDMIYLLLRSIAEKEIKGAVAELGVYQGETARIIHHYLPEKKLFLFDTFEGFDKKDIQKEKHITGKEYSTSHFSDTSLPSVLKYIDPQNENIIPISGYFPDSVTDEVNSLSYAFVHLDADLFAPTYEGLKFFYPRLEKGGIILIHDYNTWDGARSAVDQFTKENDISCIPMPDKCGSALIINSL